MGRLLLLLALPSLCLLAACTAARAADDDDLTVGGKKVTEWLTMLQSDKDVKRRRAALIALSIVGTKSTLVVPAVTTALKKDADEEIRRTAAQTLVDIKAEANEIIEVL